MKLRDISDADLVRLLLKQDDDALRELIRRYERSIYAFVFRTLRQRETAQEVVQDVFIELFEALRTYKGEASLKTYLFTIARNKTIDSIRKNKIKKVLFSAIPPFILERLKTIVIDDELDRRTIESKIHAVLGALPNDYGVIIRLKYMEGLSVKRIASKMKMTVKASESLLFRARKSFVALYSKL